MTTRRGFLAGLLAAGSAPAIGWADAGSPSYLAAAREADGAFALFGLDTGGNLTFRVPMPARGHAGAGHPARPLAVAFARRPGAFALVIDCADGLVRQRLTPPAGQSFNGHGSFSADGTRLYTVEQRDEDSAGVIGLWDMERELTRIGEVPSQGIGPHDLRLLPDGGLVVANGGIATGADGREKTNLGEMQPNLTYLDAEGRLQDQVILDPDLAQCSIRHLAVAPDGQVGFAMQWEGAPGTPVPLLGLHLRGEAPVLADPPLAEALAMRGYAGSIALSGDGRSYSISSPRGGRVQRFGRNGAFLGSVARADVCGLAAHPGGCLATDGLGGLLLLEGDRVRPLGSAPVAWDNHIVAL